jgi:hypothetical protein
MNKLLILSLIISCLLFRSSFTQFAKDSLWSKELPGSYTYLLDDFNGDGLSDKLRIDKQGDCYVSLSSGHSFLPEDKWTTNQDTNAAKYYVGDFNGDGMSDLISFKISSGVWNVSLAYQDSVNGKYSFKQIEQWNNELIKNATDLFIGDYNGDGIDDILIYSNGWMVITSNGKSFNEKRTWKNSEPYNIVRDQIHTGDFNGDRYTDIALYKSKDTCGIGTDVWLVSLAEKDSTFSPFMCWSSGQGAGSNGHFFVDLNGDRKIDKLNYYSGDSIAWYASISSGSDFGKEKLWSSGYYPNFVSAYVGDFNGDNLCDIATVSSKGEWIISLNTLKQDKIVGCWFTNWYFPGCGLWAANKRDTNKIPVVGWPDAQPLSGELYSSNNPKTINLQIDAMIKSGINLIVIDYTNGWKSYSDTTKWEDDTAHAATNALFSLMNERRLNNHTYIKIAIGLGKEFWGPRSFKRLGWNWIGWSKQYKKQRSTLDDINSMFVKRYPEIYFNYLSRPLIIPWLWIGDDFPPKENGINIPLWHYNNFTIKEAVNWSSTFANRTGPISGVTDIYINGQDRKRFWGWGAEKPQPANVECMSVMPGTYNWPGYFATGHRPADRLRNEAGSGSYYIDSWKRIIDKHPNMVLIGDWNNWNEETAIEGCVGDNSWEDLNGNKTFDWYMKITKYCSRIFLEDSLYTGVFLQQEGYPNVYKWNGSVLEINDSEYKPFREPIIKLPENWLQNHNYWKF